MERFVAVGFKRYNSPPLCRVNAALLNPYQKKSSAVLFDGACRQSLDDIALQEDPDEHQRQDGSRCDRCH